MKEAMTGSGRVTPSEELLRTRLEDAGYVDVQSFTMKQPFGPWAKERELKKLGMMVLLNGETGFHSYGIYAGARTKRCRC
jgi:hypothetical protein